jgi:hypothetical protein
MSVLSINRWRSTVSIVIDNSEVIKYSKAPFLSSSSMTLFVFGLCYERGYEVTLRRYAASIAIYLILPAALWP